MSPADEARPEPGSNATTTDIAADIEQTRAEIGATASALAAKLDVRQQARQKLEPVTSNAVPIGVALSVAVLAMLIWRRRRRRRRR